MPKPITLGFAMHCPSYEFLLGCTKFEDLGDFVVDNFFIQLLHCLKLTYGRADLVLSLY